jgi:hypothetical protein
MRDLAEVDVSFRTVVSATLRRRNYCQCETYEMLSCYFDQAVNILSTWDNGAHTLQEYQEAMLFGLNNGNDGSATQ